MTRRTPRVRYPSPLRYPGGKGKVANFIKLLIAQNDLAGSTYVEPYAGGASVALSLLFEEYVSKVVINDLNRGVHAFWLLATTNPDWLCQRICEAPLNIDEWKRQRAIYHDADSTDSEIGFATFYLNRTNRSGIISRGGVIGGIAQDGRWKIDARFDRESLCKRIAKVARFSSRIEVLHRDAQRLMLDGRYRWRESVFYLDPPYYVKGARLYDNAYGSEDHQGIRDAVVTLPAPWIVSYDAAPEILDLYSEYKSLRYTLDYSASTKINGDEVMFFSDEIAVPQIPSPTAVTSKVLYSALGS